MTPKIKEVDLTKRVRRSHRCAVCQYESDDISEFGKVQIPTSEEEWAEGMFDATMTMCEKCFSDAGPDMAKYAVRVVQKPLKKIGETKPAPRKRIKSTGGIFG